MRGFKGFDYEMKCRPSHVRAAKQYTVGKAARLAKDTVLKMCKRGLHFCEKLWDVFSYYPPFDAITGERSRYAEIITGWHGRSLKSKDLPKRCAKDMEIRNELILEEMWPRRTNGWVKQYVPIITEPGVARNDRRAVALGDRSVVISERDTALACGCNSMVTGPIAVAMGASSLAKSQHVAVAVGCASLASVDVAGAVAFSQQFAEAKESGGVAITRLCARGAVGSVLVFIQSLGGSDPTGVTVVKVDGEQVKPNIWYACDTRTGKLYRYYLKDHGDE